MTGNLPGTTLPLPEGQQDALFTVLDPIFAVSPGGLLYKGLKIIRNVLALLALVLFFR